MLVLGMVYNLSRDFTRTCRVETDNLEGFGHCQRNSFVEFGLEIPCWTDPLGWYAVVSLAKVHRLLPARLWTLQETGCGLHFTLW